LREEGSSKMIDREWWQDTFGESKTETWVTWTKSQAEICGAG